MENKIKHITESELAKLKDVQGKVQVAINKLGSLYVEKMNLKTVEQVFEKEWLDLQKLQQDTIKEIVAIYGAGNLNLEDGTITVKQKE